MAEPAKRSTPASRSRKPPQAATSANPSSLTRRENRSLVLSLVARAGAVTRAELCKLTGMTPAGISRVTRQLIELGLVREHTPVVSRGTIGRRTSPLSINPTGAYVFGVGIAANRRTVSLVNAAGEVVASRDFNQIDLADPSAICTAVVKHINDIIDTLSIGTERLLGVGIAVPADSAVAADGIVTSSILGWQQVALAGMLASQSDLPTKVISRASSLLHAATHPLGQYPGDVYLINVSVGIGCAWARFDSGTHLSCPVGGVAHLPHPQASQPCACGRHGCIEVCASGLAVVRTLALDTERYGNYASNGQHLFAACAAADAGDTAAREAYYQAGRHLAHAVDTVNTLLAPAHIVLTGVTGRQADFQRGVSDQVIASGQPNLIHKLSRSNATTAEAAGISALSHFVFSPQLDIDNLGVA